MSHSASRTHRLRQLTLAQAIAGFGLALFLVLGATAVIVGARVIEIGDQARKTRDEILPESAQHAAAAVATERLMRLTMEVVQAGSKVEREYLLQQANAIAEPLTASADVSQRQAGIHAVEAIQNAAAAAGRRDKRMEEISAALVATDNTIIEISDTLASIAEDSEGQIERYIDSFSAATGLDERTIVSRRLHRVFDINASAQNLIQEVRDARGNVGVSLATNDFDGIGALRARFSAHVARINALMQSLPKTGDFEYLPDLTAEVAGSAVIFDLRLQQIKDDGETRKNLSVATSALTALANMLSQNSAMLASESTTVILTGLQNILYSFALGGLVIVGLIIVIGILAQRLIVRPVTRSAFVLSELSEGRVVEAPPKSALRELNALSGAVASFASALRSMAEMRRLKSAADEEEERNAAMRHEMRVLANEFENTVMSSVSQIGRSADELRQSSDFMSDAISTTESLSEDSRARAAEARKNVDGVAGASKEIAAGISEIETAAAAAARQSEQGAAAAGQAKSAVFGLTEAANRIGEVVSLVSEVTKRTNLLALNATIEAARAGEAGRGFAVVAGEVKQLAGQTSEAAAEIVEHVKAIRAGVTKTSDHIDTIADVVAATTETAGQIAASVSQQASTTRNIAARAGGAADANVAVAEIIDQLNEKARSSNAVVEQVAMAANEIHHVADTLRDNVDGFLTGLRVRASK